MARRAVDTVADLFVLAGRAWLVVRRGYRIIGASVDSDTEHVSTPTITGTCSRCGEDIELVDVTGANASGSDAEN